MNRDSKELAVEAALDAIDNLGNESLLDENSIRALLGLAFNAMKQSDTDRKAYEEMVIDFVNNLCEAKAEK